MSKSKKQIEVILNGLNDFGVSELKEYYKYNSANAAYLSNIIIN